MSNSDPCSAVDNKAQSMLSFEGPKAVTGLFEFLLNEGAALAGDECDVPVLIAPTPFYGAGLAGITPKVQCGINTSTTRFALPFTAGVGSGLASASKTLMNWDSMNCINKPPDFAAEKDQVCTQV